MLRVRLKRSRLVAAALTLVHLAAAGTLVPLELAIPLKLFIVGVIAASLARGLARHALLRTGDAITEIELRDGDRAAVRTRPGVWRDARVLETTCVTARLTVINLKVEGRRLAQHVVIAPDAIDTEDFRRLRVLLRWGYRRAPAA